MLYAYEGQMNEICGIPGQHVDDIVDSRSGEEILVSVFEVPAVGGPLVVTSRQIDSGQSSTINDRDDYPVASYHRHTSPPESGSEFYRSRLGFAARAVKIEGQPHVVTIAPRARFLNHLIT